MASSGSRLPIELPPARRRSSQRELIVMVSPQAALRVSPAGLTAFDSPLLTSFKKILDNSTATMRPLFAGVRDRVVFRSQGLPGLREARTPDLSAFFKIEASDEQLDQIAHNLRSLEQVRAAYIKPPAALPVLNAMRPLAPPPPPKTPDFTSRQNYLDAAPSGVDARYAWTLAGGKGKDVRIVDVEGEWRFTHEDLLQNKGGVVGGIPPNDLDWRNHGTAVIGEFGADDNKFGITGICPDAEVSSISIFPVDQIGSSEAIRLAADRLQVGDIILLELHRPGPRYEYVDRDNQLGYIPIEWWPDDFAVIQFATSRGIVVVEAGGNGAEDLDDSLYDTPQEGFPADWKNPFKRSNRDSGAIVVGAGAPPPGTHGNSYGPDRSRLDFSNFGSIIDAQGWGREVTTCGYGDLQGGTNEDVWYTDQFGGTSSASPIIVGVIGCLQGVLRSRKIPVLKPLEVRQLLRSTGSAQSDVPGRPKSQRIGNRPDLRQIIPPIASASIPSPKLKRRKESQSSYRRPRYQKTRKRTPKPKQRKEKQGPKAALNL
jgi:Subtilase family